MRLRTLSTIIALMLITTSGFCLPADITPLTNQEYFPATQKAITQAKKSIFVVMYLISFNKDDKASKVFQLLDSLIQAKQRGVDVKVILDYQSSSSSDSPSTQFNHAAYKFLKANNINVYFDSAVIYTHTKALIIDQRIIISGSHNWSEAAFNRNNEVSFIIISPKLAIQLLDKFNRIKLPDQAVVENSGVRIPYWAMEKNGVVPAMLRKHNERGFDIWLLLLKDFNGNTDGVVDTNYEALADSLGVSKDMDRLTYRREINRKLRGLNKLYKLVAIDTEYDQPLKIRLLKKIEGESFSIPNSYWDYGWANRLNMDAKIYLLINLAVLEKNHQLSEWSFPRLWISKKYGIGMSTLYSGMKALREFNIIDVKCSDIEVGYENRMASTTTFLGLYDMREFEQALKRLEDLYGRELITKSREYAFIVFKGYDLSVIEMIANFIRSYGPAKVEEAFKVVAKKNPDNPKRSFGYVIGILSH